jgi:hypothetical protein
MGLNMAIVKVANVGQGCNKDLTPEELEVGIWSDLQNMRFRNGYVQRFNGLGQVFDSTTIVPYYLTQYQTFDKKYWIHAGLTKVFADDGTTRTEISPASAPTGSIGDRWSSAAFGGILVMTNGKDIPYFWNGNPATDLAALTNWDTNERCASIHAFKNYLVALDITKTSTRFPYMVKWSHAAVPGSLPDSWDETNVVKDAGEQDLAETPDSIVDALPLGDSLIIYKERSAYQMSFIGQPFIFQFQRLSGEHGMLAKGCGAITPKGHVILTSGDVVLNTGQNIQSIADGVIRRWIFTTIDQTNFKSAFVCANPQANEVLICFPQTGSSACNVAAVWNWETGLWGIRSFGEVYYGASGQLEVQVSDSWLSDAASWELDVTSWSEFEYAPGETRLLLSKATSIVAFDIGSTDGGVPVQGVAERVGITLDDPYSNKLIRAVYPRIDARKGAQVEVSVGSSMNAGQAVNWSAPVIFRVGEDIKVDTFAQGRFLSVRFSSDVPWRMRSFDVDVVPSGAY